MTDITPLSQHLYLTYLSLASNQLADLHHVFTILQTLPSINSLHLYPNPFFSSLGTPVSHFSLTSYTIMFLHLYSKQLRELDHLLILPSDYDRLHSLLYQINQENLIDLLSSSNREILSNHMVNYNKLKSFHQVIERIFDNQIKVLQKDQQVMMTQQAEFIRSEIKMLKTVKSLNELYDLEEIKEKREKLIENGILQQQLRPKAIPEEISSSELSNVARNDLKDEMIGGSAGMDKEIVATGESHDRRVEIHEPKLLTSEPVEAIPPEPIQSSSRLSPQSSSPGSQCESRPSSSVSVPSPSPLPADSQEVLTSNHEKEAG